MSPMTHQHDHGDRDDLAGEHRWTDTGQAILMVAFISLTALDLFVLEIWTAGAEMMPMVFQLPVFALLFVSGVFLISSSHRIVFGEVRNEPGVICKGVYRIVRHPMYLGSILIFSAFTVLSVSIVSMAILAVVVVFYVHVSRAEERILQDRYGKEYSDYMLKVPMLLPIPRQGGETGYGPKP